MSKKNPEKSPPDLDVKKREEEISDLRDLAERLADEAKKIEDSGEKAENLKLRISRLIFDINNLKKIAGNEKKFNDQLKKINEKRSSLLLEVVEAQGEVASWQVEKKAKELRDLENRAASEDMEFKKFENHYFDAEGRLGDFVNFIKKYNLEAGKEESVEKLGKLLNELKTLLDNKNYENFTTKYDGFKYVVGGLLSKAYDEKMKQEELSNTTDTTEPTKDTEPPAEPAAAPPAESTASTPAEPAAATQAKLADLQPRSSQKQRKKAGVVATKLNPSLGLGENNAPDTKIDEKEDKEREEEWEKRKTEYENAGYRFDVLKAIVTNRGKNYAALRPFAAQFKAAGTSLDEAYQATKDEDVEIFAKSLEKFEKVFAELLSKVDADTKKLYEAKKTRPVKSVKLAKPEKQEPDTKIDEKVVELRKALHRENKKKFDELVLSIKRVDAKAKQKGSFINSFKEQVDTLFVSWQKDIKLYNKKDEFDANIKLFNDTYKQAKERLEEERAKMEVKPAPPATTQAIESRPAVQKMTNKERKEYEHRKSICDDRWEDVDLLVKIIRDVDKSEGLKNKLFESYSKEGRILADFLRKAGDANNSNDAEEFNKIMGQFADAWRKFMAGLRPDIKEAFERGIMPGAVKPAEPQRSKPAEPQPLSTGKEPEKMEERKRRLDEASEDLSLLKRSITEKVTNRPPDYFVRGIGNLEKYLKNARQFVKDNRFIENIDQFQKLLSDLNKEVETAVAESKEPLPPVKLTEKEVLGQDITRIKSVDLKLTPLLSTELPQEPAPVVKEVPKQPAVMETGPSVEAAPIEEQPPIPPSPPEKKKSLWGRFKEGVKKTKDAVFNRETGLAAGKMSYDTITSVLGIKLATDAVYGLATGKGDLAMWWKGRKESKATVESMAAALKSITELSEKANKSKALDESEKTEKRIVDFKTQIESANISSEAKKALLDRWESIATKNHEDKEKAKKERDEEVRRVMDVYTQSKISGMKIAKDAMNFALTATGLSMLRGIMYAGVSIAERTVKARKEYAKRGLKENAQKTELAFVAKDVLVNAALETVRALTLRGEKEGANKKTKTIDFIKAIGTVARGFGIYGLALSGSDSTEQSIDKLISSIKEQGVAVAVSDNFIHNAERTLHLNANQHKDSAAPEQPQRGPDLGPEVLPQVSTEPELPQVVEPVHETPVVLEQPESVNHTVAVEVIAKKEGILHGVNRIIHNNPDIFTHENGKPWTAAEIHTWKVNELKSMGFKYEGGKWGHPLTVHAGAQVEVYTDEQGRPHFKLASDEHVTFNKNYKWADTEPVKITTPEELQVIGKTGEEDFKIVDTGAVAGRKGDYLINPFPDSNEINHAPTANADVLSESAVAPKQVKVDANIKEMAVVHHAPKATVVDGANVSAEKTSATPDVSVGEKTADQFFKEHNSSPKEFLGTLHNMGRDMTTRLEDSFIPNDKADDFLREKFTQLAKLEEKYRNMLESGQKLNDADLEQIDKLLQTENLYNNKGNWVESLDKTIFSKDDNEVMRLAFAPHKNPDSHPILTNNSHAVRIWNAAEKKDVLWYIQDTTFNLDKNGNLVMADPTGVSVMSKEEVLNMAR